MVVFVVVLIAAFHRVCFVCISMYLDVSQTG